MLKGVEERPWKERDQSTGSPAEFTAGAEGVGVSGRGAALAIKGGGSSERPFLRERMLDWDVMSLFGAGLVGVDDMRTGTAVLVGVGFSVEGAVDVAVREEGVGVDVRVVGLARLTAAAARAIGVCEKVRLPLFVRAVREMRRRLLDVAV